ncbi:alpha/beta fold hydrolase [Blastococcus sp. Marseille-P5729]|uniref:alpha/beta fold hydrolase n=1 Tax=Blastococcus sp. Marseille-P5729 TaxID=2086582 RepID=UPI00131ADF6D|nr:alpha/beta hydrolase [Blastococcus sp. Marseille-P5729]
MAKRNKTLALVAGGLAGATAVLNTARVIAERATVRRLHERPDPYRDIEFGALPSDRHYTVTATDGTPLYVEEVGPMDAPVTVIFAHGYTHEMGSFHFQRLALSQNTDPTMRLVFFDQRSHGRSGHSEAADCTIDQLGADLEQVVEAASNEDDNVIVVGHSMGGMTIMGLADRRPGLFGTRIVGAVLMSTSAGNLMAAMRASLPSTLVQRALPALARGARFAPRSVERGRRLTADTIWLLIRRYAFGSEGASASLADYVDRMVSSTPLDVVADFYPTLAGHDKVQALAALAKAEVLIICGDEDKMTPLEHSELIAKEIPAADLFVVPGAGHMAMMEQPELCNEQVIGFVRRVLSPKRKKKPA